MKNITSKIYLVFTVLSVAFLLDGCKKDVSPQEPAEINSSELGKVFNERGYETVLIQPLGDTLSITWTPSWDKPVTETKNDTVENVRIPMIPELKNIKTGKIVSDAHFLGFARYIKAKIAKTTTFYLAIYTTNSEVTVVNPDTFSGLMTLKNLETGSSTVYKYLNGKQI
jgi:hypothetical protein